MSTKTTFYFDAKDRELLTVVNSFLERNSRDPEQNEHMFFHTGLHPHGIKEMAMSQEIRVAYAVINLLGSLEAGQQVQDRINALRALHDEVLYSATSSFRHNTGRVLVQIMKNLIRAHGDLTEQLCLAHDFRKAASGKRRIIRDMLQRYYLLEMPEEWNQVSFDNHVHDANTKGRKSPTHLIMDAWIKGIRKLDVVYYNFVDSSAVAELLQAADIMDIEVNIGVEFQALFRNRYVQFIWQPRGFADWRDMLAFLDEKPTQHLMWMGREASIYHHHYVMQLLDEYNSRLRHDLGNNLGIELTEISKKEILSFVGIGQTSRTHLAELMFLRIRDGFAPRLAELKAAFPSASPEDRLHMQQTMDTMNTLSPEGLIEDWLGKDKNPSVLLPHRPGESHKAPEIMRLLPATLIDWLTSIRSHCHIILNLRSLEVEDVLELLYECEGMITHLELFNLKNYETGHMAAIKEISDLQTAINEGSAVALKRLIRNTIKSSGCSDTPEAEERCKILTEILHNIPKLQSFYSVTPLKARIGSDSTSRSSQVHGMGFANIETLPPRARRALRHQDSMRKTLPVSKEVFSQVTYYPRRHLSLGRPLTTLLRNLPGLSKLGMMKKEAWKVEERCVHYSKKGNVTTLGGFKKDPHLAFSLEEKKKDQGRAPGLTYINTTVKNIFKVAIGFAVTVATFLYTQDWWFLAWFGPFIWFGITGYRNILQATLGGGGFRRTPLLTWNAYLSWTRLCDSLMFTGFSVPLLELGVRMFLLERVMGITTETNALLCFTLISIVNGMYIAGHNLFRGLPMEAVIGNIFRSVLAVPVSLFYNFMAYKLFTTAGWDVVILAQGAAVLSKLASDSVAAIIEGLADKAEYLRMRHWDFKAKMTQLFTTLSRLEMLLPEDDVIDSLRRPKDFIPAKGSEVEELEKVVIVNSLDLMYFWMYQPRARSTLSRLLVTMTEEERALFAHAQLVLLRVHKISQMLVDGLIGLNFAQPLAFYLARHEEYLRDIEKITEVDILHLTKNEG